MISITGTATGGSRIWKWMQRSNFKSTITNLWVEKGDTTEFTVEQSCQSHFAGCGAIGKKSSNATFSHLFDFHSGDDTFALR